MWNGMCSSCFLFDGDRQLDWLLAVVLLLIKKNIIQTMWKTNVELAYLNRISGVVIDRRRITHSHALNINGGRSTTVTLFGAILLFISILLKFVLYPPSQLFFVHEKKNKNTIERRVIRSRCTGFAQDRPGKLEPKKKLLLVFTAASGRYQLVPNIDIFESFRYNL